MTSAASNRTSLRIRRRLRRLVVWVPLAILIAWSVVPILWSLSASLKDPLEVYQANWLPREPTVGNYGELLGSSSFWRRVASWSRYTARRRIYSLSRPI